MQFNFEIRGLEELRKRLDKLRHVIAGSRMRSLLEGTKNTAVAIARRLVPKRSYRLRNHINGKIEHFGTLEPKIRIGVFGMEGEEYPLVQEFGTKKKDYPIRPSKKYWLWWRTKGNFQRIFSPYSTTLSGRRSKGVQETFSKGVIHPGVKGSRYIAQSIEQVRPRLLQALRKLLDDELKGK